MTPEVTRSATITRGPSTDEGTPGKYVSDRGFTCATGELPYLDDAANVSCEKPGRYLMLWQWSQEHGCNLYHMQTNDGRVAIEAHKGNLCGDVAKGYGSDVKGCILFGESWELFKAGSIHPDPAKPPRDQHGVTASGAALAAFEKDMQNDAGEQEPFWLTIQ